MKSIVEEDLKLKKLKERIDKRVLAFILEEEASIVRQARDDTESEVPQVPLFDDYLSKLEVELESEVGKLGYFNGVVRKLIQNYRNVFYYSSLPNLMERNSGGYLL